MKIQYLVYIPTIVGLLSIGLVVIAKNATNKLNRLFIAFDLSIVLWLTCLFVADTSSSSSQALLWIRLAILMSSIIPLLFLWFAYAYPSFKRIPIFFKSTALVLPLVFIGLSFNPMIIGAVEVRPWGAEVTQSGWLYTVQTFFFLGYFFLGIALLINKSKKSKGSERAQLRLIALGAFVAVATNIFTNIILVQVGISKYGLLLGVPANLVLTGFIAYAIVRHKLFDIKAVVARSVTFILSISVVGFAYGFFAYRFLDIIFKKNYTITREIVSVLFAMALAFTFGRIRRTFEKLTDKIFYRDKYDPQGLINNIGRILASEIELSALSNKLISELTAQMRLDDANIVIIDEGKIVYDAHAGQHEPYQMAELKKLGKSVIVTDDLQSGERKQILNKNNTGISLALRTSEEFVGFLFAGHKLSGDIYSDNDIRVLRIVANELAIGVQNALAYEQIQAFNETLQAKVDDATKRLRHANDELKQLDQAKDEFISMASHQLRTPLTTTKGYVSMVLEGDFGKPTRDMIEPLTQALDSANRMARMVNDLLNVSRMDAGKFFIDAHETDLSQVVPQEVAGLQSLAESKQVALSYHEPKRKIPLVNLDEDKMRQVIMNLIDNSIHYGNKTPGEGKTDVYLELVGREVVFRVVDNGIGVPKAMKPKMFGKFFRASNAQNARPDGTGLGLYLVKRVVEDHGGEIIFESEEGKGSTFGFRMPLRTVIHNDPKAVKRLAQVSG